MARRGFPRVVRRSAAYPHGRSIKNPATYEALKRCGHSKESAAAISNWALKAGFKRGRHRSGGRC